MTDTPVFEIGGPDKDWHVETVVGVRKVRGRFILNTLGAPIWFQTTSGAVYFMAQIISVARPDPRKREPYAEVLPNPSGN